MILLDKMFFCFINENGLLHSSNVNCAGPGSCRISPIHFMSEIHTRPTNQALVWLGLVLFCIVTVVYIFVL